MKTKDTAKLQSKVNEIVAKWAAKGYTHKQIIQGLWDWRAIRSEYKDGTYTFCIGGFGTKTTTWTL